MRPTIRSDRTLVPPVTADLSPPDSRMTGADSPVMADSSTDAMPCTTSPSLAMKSPASTSTISPCFSCGAATTWKLVELSVASRFAVVSVRALRSVAACALPRPSATASAKFANSTVIHSQKMIWKVNPRWAASPVTHSRMKITVVSAATTSTTNITGFLISKRGSSLTNDWPIAGTRIAGSSIEDCELRMLLLLSMGLAACVIEGAGVHCEMLDDRPKGNRREVDQSAGDHDHAHHQADEQRAVGGERPRRDRHDLLPRQRTGDRQHRDDHQEAPHEHRHAECVVPERHIGGNSGERAAVVAGCRGVGVKRLGKAVRPGVVHRTGADRQHDSQRSPSQDRQWQ